MLTEVIKTVALRRLTKLQHLMEENNLPALILFENDFVAYKLSLTQHFNIVLVTLNDIYVFADTTLYHEARRESPWSVIAIEDFTLEEVAKKILSLLPNEHRGKRLGVNKLWGRNKLSFLYKDLLDTLCFKNIEILDATRILTEVFDKPYKDELIIIEWISRAASKALQVVCEYLKPGMLEYEVAAIIDKVLDENGIVNRWFSTIVASGPRAASPHVKTSSRKIRYGDPVIIDMGPVWMGYDGCSAYLHSRAKPVLGKHC